MNVECRPADTRLIVSPFSSITASSFVRFVSTKKKKKNFCIFNYFQSHLFVVDDHLGRWLPVDRSINRCFLLFSPLCLPGYSTHYNQWLFSVLMKSEATCHYYAIITSKSNVYVFFFGIFFASSYSSAFGVQSKLGWSKTIRTKAENRDKKTKTKTTTKCKKTK